MQLNDKILLLRKKKGWSQEQLADQVGRVKTVGF